MSLAVNQLLILAAEESHGAAANPVAFNWVPFVAALVIFGIAFFVLATMVWPKILGGLDDRANKIRSEVFAAEELRKAAAEEKKQFERTLTDARAESARIIEQTRSEQSRLAADLRAKAEVELNAMRDEAKATIEAAKKAAINEIYAETATLATAVASKILQREVKVTDQAQLIEDSMGRLEKQFASR
ncbi:MAG: F0F1 ATP synthase subunit B [Phycisphaerae bacterium]|nr:F0F1 ATP synthase subunit B [Phycisphaerae bacterium]